MRLSELRRLCEGGYLMFAVMSAGFVLGEKLYAQQIRPAHTIENVFQRHVAVNFERV